MEKYGCNRLEELELRIKEIESRREKTAAEDDELLQLYETRKDLINESYQKN